MRIEIEIDESRVADCLCAAWEGGSSYWARAEGQPYDDDGKLILGKTVQRIAVYDLECDTGEGLTNRHFLTLGKVRRGLATMAVKAPRQFAALLSDEGDAVTGDCLLQCSLFGDVLYG